MGRLPTPADFPSTLKLNIIPPPPSDPPTNILILLHGLGDTHTPFTHLAAQLRLPETACVIPLAPQPLLDLGGNHWGDDIVFDSSSGGLDPDAGFKGSTRFLLRTLVKECLMGKCGYAAREILVLGWGQGGMAGLRMALGEEGAEGEGEEKEGEVLGGIVSIGGGLGTGVKAKAKEGKKVKTPVLVCAGAEGSSGVTTAAEEGLRREFEFVEVVRWRRPDDGMPRDREEMMPIMRFLARRLRSVKGVPEGSVEIG